MEWNKQHLKLKTFADWRQLYKSCQKQQIFGLDIGSSSVKIVQLRRNENGYIVSGAAIAFLNDLNGQIDNDGNISKTIRQCWQSAQIKNKLAVCGVCGQETAVRHFNFPSLLPDEIEGAVQLEAKQVCPFNTDDGVIDYQVISGDKKEIRGFLVVAAHKLLRDKGRFVKDAAINNVLMDIDGLALMNCMRYCREYEKGTFAILNVGHEYTTLAIVGDDDLPFVRDINFAGKAIIENLSSGSKIKPVLIEKALRGEQDSQDVQLFNIREGLESACHKLISNITETLYYDAVHRKSEIVDKIYLCGGFALVDGFADLLKTKLPTETILWNPFDKIPCEESLTCSDLLRNNGPAFAVAAGLAMREI